jgi:toxin FitB
MRDVVLDTDVASLLFRGRLTGRLAGALAGRRLHVTFVTVGELWKGAALRGWGLRNRAELMTYLHGVVILPGGEAVAKLWGATSAAAEQRGRTLPVNDSWIAACCLARELPLATLNLKDFADLAENEGLELVGV